MAKKVDFITETKRILECVDRVIFNNSHNGVDQFIKISILVRSLLATLHKNKLSVYDMVENRSAEEIMTPDIKKDWEEIWRLLGATKEWEKTEEENKDA